MLHTGQLIRSVLIKKAPGKAWPMAPQMLGHDYTRVPIHVNTAFIHNIAVTLPTLICRQRHSVLHISKILIWLVCSFFSSQSFWYNIIIRFFLFWCIWCIVWYMIILGKPFHQSQLHLQPCVEHVGVGDFVLLYVFSKVSFWSTLWFYLICTSF